MMDEQTANALRGWIERSRNDRTVTTAVYDGRALVGEIATTDPDTVVALVRDVVSLAGKAWAGRVALRDAQGVEILSVPVRCDPELARVPVAPSASDVGASIGAEGLKALTDALKQSQAHAHAFAQTMLATTRELAGGASAIIQSTDKALVTLAERATRADTAAATMEELLKQALESAQESNAALERERGKNRDFTELLVKAFGPQVKQYLQGVGAPPIAAIQEQSSTPIQEDPKPS